MSQISITPPPELAFKIKAYAKERNLHPARVCLEAVAEHFGVALEEPRRRPRWVPPPKLLVPQYGRSMRGRALHQPVAADLIEVEEFAGERGGAHPLPIRVNERELEGRKHRLTHLAISQDEPLGGEGR